MKFNKCMANIKYDKNDNNFNIKVCLNTVSVGPSWGVTTGESSIAVGMLAVSPVADVTDAQTSPNPAMVVSSTKKSVKAPDVSTVEVTVLTEKPNLNTNVKLVPP